MHIRDTSFQARRRDSPSLQATSYLLTLNVNFFVDTIVYHGPCTDSLTEPQSDTVSRLEGAVGAHNSSPTLRFASEAGFGDIGFQPYSLPDIDRLYHTSSRGVQVTGRQSSR